MRVQYAGSSQGPLFGGSRYDTTNNTHAHYMSSYIRTKSSLLHRLSHTGRLAPHIHALFWQNALATCTHSLTHVHTSLYTFTLLVCSANQLCLGRLAYRGNLFGLDERVTEKVKRGFAFRMRYLMRSILLCGLPSLR